MAAVINVAERVTKVQIEGLALMKIVKHCHDCLPSMATGSLLGLAVDGVLEVTHAFASPEAGKDSEIDEGYQIEMMRMLREVNVDDNCVGWYQSMYLGVFSTSNVLETQFSYQTDLSPNAVVMLYDPMQTTKGNFCLKAYRLSDEAMKLQESDVNAYIEPGSIFEEVPVTCTNPALVNAAVQDWVPKTDMSLDRLDLSINPYLEKHLEFMSGWVDELTQEQQKFQYHARQLARNKESKSKEAWESSEAPKRMNSLLLSNQLRSYCDQVDAFAGNGLSKLFLAGGLHKEER